MSDRNHPFAVDPARRRILALQDQAGARGELYLPTPEALRLLLQEACEEVGSPEVWAMRLGCTPEHLAAVLDGRKRAGGDMLDVIGLEWLPARGVYSDPHFDRRALTQRLQRHGRQFRNDVKAESARRMRRVLRDIKANEAQAAPPVPQPAKAETGTVVPFRRRPKDDDLDETLGRT